MNAKHMKQTNPNLINTMDMDMLNSLLRDTLTLYLKNPATCHFQETHKTKFPLKIKQQEILASRQLTNIKQVTVLILYKIKLKVKIIERNKDVLFVYIKCRGGKKILLMPPVVALAGFPKWILRFKGIWVLLWFHVGKNGTF